jgi:hypothetical protein
LEVQDSHTSTLSANFGIARNGLEIRAQSTSRNLADGARPRLVRRFDHEQVFARR